jgi:hypothetical protein
MSKMTCVAPSTAEGRMCAAERPQKTAKARKSTNKRPPKTAKAIILHVFLIDIKLSKNTCACAKQHEHCQEQQKSACTPIRAHQKPQEPACAPPKTANAHILHVFLIDVKHSKRHPRMGKKTTWDCHIHLLKICVPLRILRDMCPFK